MSVKRLGRQKGYDYPAGLNLAKYGTYQVNKSLRFRSSASPYLTRTYAAYGDRTKITISVWVKRGTLANGATAQEIMTGSSGATRGGQLTFGDTTDQLLFEFGGSTTYSDFF